MAEEAIVSIPMDAKLLEEVEQLYTDMGTTFAEAVRMFARQSVNSSAMPFEPHVERPPKTAKRIGVAKGKFVAPDDLDATGEEKETMRPFGIAKGKFTVPDDFDEDADEMAKLFGVA